MPSRGGPVPGATASAAFALDVDALDGESISTLLPPPRSAEISFRARLATIRGASGPAAAASVLVGYHAQRLQPSSSLPSSAGSAGGGNEAVLCRNHYWRRFDRLAGGSEPSMPCSVSGSFG